MPKQVFSTPVCESAFLYFGDKHIHPRQGITGRFIFSTPLIPTCAYDDNTALGKNSRSIYIF
ncbi:MAG: hypothetical protein B6I19_06395 [Bacteroidetes bacterium 4572_114]|nr:MAG: hypothetical protein B6I19_06395 [Bacteroidetes bacterium 4572_114]